VFYSFLCENQSENTQICGEVDFIHSLHIENTDNISFDVVLQMSDITLLSEEANQKLDQRG
jgi:hypothetical protein